MAGIESVCLAFTLDFVNFVTSTDEKRGKRNCVFVAPVCTVSGRLGTKKKPSNVNIVYLVGYGEIRIKEKFSY